MKTGKVRKLKVGDRIMIKIKGVVVENDDMTDYAIKVFTDDFGAAAWVSGEEIIRKVKQ